MKIFWACVALILVLILSTSTRLCGGAASTEERVAITEEGRALFEVMFKQQGFRMPHAYPTYSIGTTAGIPRHCERAGGCYYHGHVWIMYPAVIGEIDRLGVLVHENVHHLQWEQYGDAHTCEENRRREIEALTAQQIYLYNNHNRNMVHVAPVQCKGGK